MKPTIQQHNDFLSHLPVDGLDLEHNDPVLVVNGMNKGKRGVVVSIIELGEDPLLIIELETGKDVEEKQTNIEKINF
ncbi:MAG: hypothetical protein OEZ10_08000 [Gammaproteobacteria bacterium]|nr:hypothetical protein [Gammaproteobacteria bacterium]